MLFFSCSQDNLSAIPVDFGFLPLGANDRVYWDDVFFLDASVEATLATRHIFSRLHCEDYIVSLPRQLIVVNQVKSWAIRGVILLSHPNVSREEDAVVAFGTNDPDWQDRLFVVITYLKVAKVLKEGEESDL